MSCQLARVITLDLRVVRPYVMPAHHQKATQTVTGVLEVHVLRHAVGNAFNLIPILVAHVLGIVAHELMNHNGDGVCFRIYP